MGEVSPAVRFTGILRTRGGGTGAKRFMEENPEIGEFIQSITGWKRVQPGSLTLDHAAPLPLPTLSDVRPLAQQPENLARNMRPDDARRAAKRGAPAYYGGVARAGAHSRLIVLSQQPRPAVALRLEILADVLLRCALHVCDDDEVSVDIYHAEDWPAIIEAKPACD